MEYTIHESNDREGEFIMKSSNELRTLLRSVDHKSYPAYKALAGAYQFGSFVLVIDHVQGDPFAHRPACILRFPPGKRDFRRNI